MWRRNWRRKGTVPCRSRLVKHHGVSSDTSKKSGCGFNRGEVFVQPVENLANDVAEIGGDVAGFEDDQPLVFFGSTPETEHGLGLHFGRLVEIVASVQHEQRLVRAWGEVDAVDLGWLLAGRQAARQQDACPETSLD